MPLMLKRVFRRIWRYILIFGILAILAATLPSLSAGMYARDRIYEPGEAPEKRVAIIFGAGLRRDGTPTAMLRDRVLTGAELYFSGKVEKLLMSGDNRFVDHNEPESMRQFALSVGVPDEAIVMDYA